MNEFAVLAMMVGVASFYSPAMRRWEVHAGYGLVQHVFSERVPAQALPLAQHLQGVLEKQYLAQQSLLEAVRARVEQNGLRTRLKMPRESAVIKVGKL